MNTHRSLNHDWKFINSFDETMLSPEWDEGQMTQIRIPHTNAIMPYNYGGDELYQSVSLYRRHLYVEQELSGKQMLLTFEGVAHMASVYVNNQLAGIHKGGYTAFTVNISEFLMYGQDNLIAVVVDSRENLNIPPFGYVMDYLTYGGIYREVYLDIKEAIYIGDIFVVTKDSFRKIHETEPDTKTKEVELNVELKNTLQESKPQLLQVRFYLFDSDNREIYSGLDKIDGYRKKICFQIEDIQEWNIESPHLYRLDFYLQTQYEEKLLDQKSIRFGFRTCEFLTDGFYLNHKKVKIIGLNRHQSFPYVGYAMPKNMQRRDAEILKNELQVNAVRTSHYPQSQHFINRCDELGLLVFTELPGWQHIGDEEWKEVACKNVEEMVKQYRNHPSIILWGVRINESLDDDNFYQKTNNIAHELDPTRQTGGVRYLKKSHLLEDVYTYNDFLHNGTNKGIDRKKDVTSNQQAAYLISEFNGHMYPMKSFDDEKHRLEHALRHCCVLDEIRNQSDVAGGFGWCLFDYNTHKDFGSGDMICYHGVMDMFRNPKLAAAVYASQGSDRDVCEISSSLDIGEHPAGNIGIVYGFTNADSIRLYKNDVFVKEFFPSIEKYHSMQHPPIIIDDFVGELLQTQENYNPKIAKTMKEILFAVRDYGQNQLPFKYMVKMLKLMIFHGVKLSEGTRLYYKYIGGWGGEATVFRFEAVKDNKIVKEIVKRPIKNPKLVAETSSTELIEEETYDVAAIRITAVDQDNNLLPYYQEPVQLKTWGAIELIGPDLISLKGGASGCYVKTKGVKGEGGLDIFQNQIVIQKMIFNVR